MHCVCVSIVVESCDYLHWFFDSLAFLDASCLFRSIESSKLWRFAINGLLWNLFFWLFQWPQALWIHGWSFVTTLGGWRVCVCAFLFGSRGCKYRCECERELLHSMCISVSACKRKKTMCACVKWMCVCGEQGSGPWRPRPPSVNWKRRLLSQRQGSNQGSVSETKGTLLK